MELKFSINPQPLAAPAHSVAQMLQTLPAGIRVAYIQMPPPCTDDYDRAYRSITRQLDDLPFTWHSGHRPSAFDYRDVDCLCLHRDAQSLGKWTGGDLHLDDDELLVDWRDVV